MTRHAGENKKQDFLPIVLALDGPWADVKIWTERLQGLIWGCKVGSVLFAEKGPRIVEDIQAKGFRVFLDLKFHDIPNTVQLSVRRAFSWGVDLLTVHASGGRAMLQASAAEQKAQQKIVAVTVLTSLDVRDLSDLGISRSLDDQVHSLADLAMNAGIAGLVCSPKEVAGLREKYSRAVLVTPGVRSPRVGAATENDDQKRTETLETTLRNGASLAVLGRALTEVQDWKEEWKKITSFTAEKSFKKPLL